MGGAGNVHANLTRLIATGTRECEAVLVREGNLPLKTRLVDESTGQQVARFDFEDYCEPLTPDYLDPYVKMLEPEVVVVSDYGKGAVTSDLIGYLRGLRVPLYVDTKRDPSPWIGASGLNLFPNEAEYEACAAAYAAASQVILTRSANGIARLTKPTPTSSSEDSALDIVEAYPALCPPHRVQSVCGAGDTVVAAFTYAVLTNIDPSPTRFANAAASASVRLPYTSTPSLQQVANEYEMAGYQPLPLDAYHLTRP
jgi:bifunctional ADP-heptose synthase (sugar kinase/adenylyltransferase)